MNDPIERRVTLRKATAADLIGSLTGDPTPTPAPQPPTPPVAARAQQRTTKATTTAPDAPAARPRPGRPRGRRRMEPFSSKIEIDLRDQVDAHVARTGETIIDLLDRALRAALDTTSDTKR